jgi:methionine-gamma-lyase
MSDEQEHETERDGLQTRLIHEDSVLNETHAVTPPIWQTSTFGADSPEHFIEMAKSVHPTEFYTRYGNPTHAQVEKVIASLESGEAALVTGSGMGAIFVALMCVLERGDHVVAQRSLYGGTASLFESWLPRWGITSTFVDPSDTQAFARAVQPNTKLIYTETPTNPVMSLTDLRAVSEIARGRGILTMTDNTFASPVNQRPIEHGIDVVLHSATKYIGGHSDVTAGIIVGSREFVERAWSFGIVAGASLSPFDSWLLLRGLRTLGVRVERHNHNALALARFLERHAKVARVNYPGLESHPQHALAVRQMDGFTGVLSVEVAGGYAAAEKLCTSLRLGKYAASLGGYETLVVHPAAMWAKTLTAEQRATMGVGDSLMRVSVGIEDEKDLVADFAQALDSL